MNLLKLQIASSYASAWFKQAKEADILEQVYQDIILLKQVFGENKNLLRVLKSPIIPGEKKLAILQQIFSSHVHGLTLNVFSIMSKNKREDYLLPIVQKFLEIHRAHYQIQLASVITPCKLPTDLAGYLKDLVKNWKSCKEVILTEHVNPVILGGFILRAGDQQLDNSLVSRLNKLKKEFSPISD